MSLPDLSERFREEVSFDCAFCGMQCWAGYMDPGDVPCVLHKAPHCAEFAKDESPTKFMERNRRRKAAS